MSLSTFTVTVHIEYPGSPAPLSYVVPRNERIGELIGRLFSDLKLSGPPTKWVLTRAGRALVPASMIGDEVGVDQTEVLLRLQPLSADTSELLSAPHTPLRATPQPAADSQVTRDVCESGFEMPALQEEGSEPATVDTETESSDFDLALDDSELAADEESGSQVVALDEDKVKIVVHDEIEAERVDDQEREESVEDKPQLKKSRDARVSAKGEPKAAPVNRQMTVRYYSQMNPQRVYPLLVLITQQMVQQVQNKGADQKSSRPFKVDVDTIVEIEPILPGCVCHPAKITTRITQQNQSLLYHVVPHVVGKVAGAVVKISQDHRSLAEVKLKVKVVERTTVLVCGTLTFVLPFASAIARHVGLDFEAAPGSGFSLYVALAQALPESLAGGVDRDSRLPDRRSIRLHKPSPA